jgi:hypothetical protein
MPGLTAYSARKPESMPSSISSRSVQSFQPYWSKYLSCKTATHMLNRPRSPLRELSARASSRTSKHYINQMMVRILIVLAVVLSCAAPWSPLKAAESNQPAMIFLPPGAAYCKDFLRLEPMKKYDQSNTPIREGDAQDYFTYRGIEEWVRGFVSAANILNAKNGSGDATKGKDLYELMPSLFEYCRSHREEIFSNAAMQFLPSARSSANK